MKIPLALMLLAGMAVLVAGIATREVYVLAAGWLAFSVAAIEVARTTRED